MYTILSDEKVFYSPELSNEGYGVISPKVTVELNKAGSMSCILPPTNVMYDNIQKLKSIVTVLQDEKEIFRGRVLHDEKDFYGRKNMYCEGDLAFLVDSKQRPYSFRGDIPELFRQYITNHNKRVDEEKRFAVGMVTVTDANGYISRENKNYVTTLDEIKDKLLNSHGGYIRTRLFGGTRYIDLIEDYEHINTQTIEFGVNLLDITEYIDATDVFTVLIPLGEEITDADGNSSRLTIESVNNGKDYIEDETAIALFGRIERVQEWDDVTIASNLLNKAKEFLKNGIEMAVSLVVKAVDLHLLNVDIEQIRLGDYVRVVSLPHKLDKYFLCSKIVYDLANPDKTEYTFGVTFATMTEKYVDNSKTMQSTMNVTKSSAQSAENTAGQTEKEIQNIKNVIVELPTEYVKTETFETYKKAVNSKISSAYRYKGSVENYDLLPTSNLSTGDTYNLLDNGANYAWTGSEWDKLSETIDLSGYVTQEIFDALVLRVSALEKGEENV